MLSNNIPMSQSFAYIRGAGSSCHMPYNWVFSEFCTSVTKAETPEGVSTEPTNTRAKNPAGANHTNPQGFILAGVGFGNPRK